MPDRFYTVTINRWDAYRVTKVMASSETEAEEIALSTYQESSRYEHVEGGVTSVEAVPDEE
mgnify:CR=1 FL=1